MTACPSPLGVQPERGGRAFDAGGLNTQAGAPPCGSGIAFSSLLAGATQSGVEDGTVKATDAGGGLWRAALQVDGREVLSVPFDDRQGQCALPFAQVRPCAASGPATLRFDTASLPDGAHEGSILVSDVTGTNQAIHGPFPLQTVEDPVACAPGKPGATFAGGLGKAGRRGRSPARGASCGSPSCASPDADLRVGDDVPMSQAEPPVVRIDVLETFVELLTRSEDDGSSDAFYSSLCEAVCRLTSMDRAIIFRYDEARRRVRAAGAYGISLDHFTNSHITVESAPIARQALIEDRVIEMDADVVARQVPERFRDLLDGSTLACCPLSAGGRWSGVILADRRPRKPLSDAERDLLWTLGKSAALAEAARHATFQGERARQLQERIDLAREVHEGVIQRLFGVLLVVSSDGPLGGDARERVTVELQAALRDLRRALQRPLGRMARATDTTLLEEVARLRDAYPDLGIELTTGSAQTAVPKELEPLAQSVLVEAVRNARKHAEPSRVEVDLERQEGAWVMEVSNDGVRGRSRTISGMGLRLAALEALQVGGLVEFGEREPGVWRVRLAVPQ